MNNLDIFILCLLCMILGYSIKTLDSMMKYYTGGHKR